MQSDSENKRYRDQYSQMESMYSNHVSRLNSAEELCYKSSRFPILHCAQANPLRAKNLFKDRLTEMENKNESELQTVLDIFLTHPQYFLHLTWRSWSFGHQNAKKKN